MVSQVIKITMGKLNHVLPSKRSKKCMQNTTGESGTFCDLLTVNNMQSKQNKSDNLYYLIQDMRRMQSLLNKMVYAFVPVTR